MLAVINPSGAYLSSVLPFVIPFNLMGDAMQRLARAMPAAGSEHFSLAVTDHQLVVPDDKMLRHTRLN